MADYLLFGFLGLLLHLLGFIGCFVPVLPGPLIAYASLWLLTLWGYPISATALCLWSLVLIIVSVLDYVLPSICAKRFRCSGVGVFGSFVGTIIGLFFLPWGLFLGPFLGAALGELLAGRDLRAALKGGLGALLGFFLCLFLKLLAVAAFCWQFWVRFPASP